LGFLSLAEIIVYVLQYRSFHRSDPGGNLHLQSLHGDSRFMELSPQMPHFILLIVDDGPQFGILVSHFRDKILRFL
jgi:hypothetical protein